MDRPTRISVLGPVRVERDGSKIPVRGATGRSVLAALVLAEGRVVSNDSLIDAVWGDALPANPVRDLRSAVSRLRSAIGSEAIETVGNGYRLVSDVVWTDVAELGAIGDSVTADRIREVLDRWDGDALGDVNPTTRFEAERARLDELRAQLVDRYHSAMLDEGRAEETLPTLRRDAESSALRESTYLLLMSALARCARIAEALRVGNTYRNHLVEETGLEPSRAHRELMNSLLATESEPVAPPATASHASTTTPSTTAPPTTDGPPDAPVEGARRTPRPPANPFVGRQREIGLVADALDQAQLVTIAGPGGVGKSRLALEFVAARWPGAIVVALAGLGAGRPVDGPLAAALGIEVAAVGDLRGALTDRLSARPERLVLDTCEHVMASVVELFETVLRDSEGVQVLATSRRRVGLADEIVVPLAPLELDIDRSGSSAVDLFADRVRRVGGPPITGDDLSLVADICRLLDGLPLALELAAARVPMLGLTQLRRALVDGVSLPTPIAGDDDRRQATVDSSVRWSIDLLSPEASEAFSELCTFPSTFDLEAAVAVAGSERAVDAIAELIDSSLVHLDGDGPVYRVLHPTRQVGRRLASAAIAERALDRYVRWVEAVASEIEDAFYTDRRRQAHDLVQRRRDDLTWTLDHLRSTGQRRRHGRMADAIAPALTDRPEPALIEACWSAGDKEGTDVATDATDGLFADAMLSWTVGEFDQAIRVAQRLSAALPHHDDRRGLATWAELPAHLYLGDTAAVDQGAPRMIADPTLPAAIRAETVALWSLSELYAGRPDRSVEILSDHEETLAGSGVGGFVTFARAEVAAVVDPTSRLELLERSAQEAAASGSSFQHRLTEIAHLAVLVDESQLDDARELALDLLPRVIAAATIPQAWTALRHVARLLAELDEPSLAVRILDAAELADAAPGVVGDDRRVLDDVRLTCEAAGATTPREAAAVPIGQLWDDVEASLRDLR